MSPLTLKCFERLQYLMIVFGPQAYVARVLHVLRNGAG